VIIFKKKLKAGGHITKGFYEGWYSNIDECFYSEANVNKADGGDSKVLAKETGSTVEWVREENYIFDLKPFTERIHSWLLDSGSPSLLDPCRF